MHRSHGLVSSKQTSQTSAQHVQANWLGALALCLPAASDERKRLLVDWSLLRSPAQWLIPCCFSAALAPRGTHGSQWMVAESCKTRLD